VTNELVHEIDFLATIAAAVGANTPDPYLPPREVKK
jgi:hypothetical protein